VVNGVMVQWMWDAEGCDGGLEAERLDMVCVCYYGICVPR
jgi:hypothetical protein